MHEIKKLFILLICEKQGALDRYVDNCLIHSTLYEQPLWAFPWETTPEGFQYWYDVQDELEEEWERELYLFPYSY